MFRAVVNTTKQKADEF